MDQLFLFSVASTKSLAKFMEIIASQGGMSMSNNFDVEFSFVREANIPLLRRMRDLGIGFSSYGNLLTEDENLDTSAGSVLKVLCEEAQLPNVQAATGTTTGVRLGEGSINYAHTKLYTDFQLGWMCDANMTPLKFLNAWYSFIFGEFDSGNNEIFGKTGATSAPSSATSFNAKQQILEDLKGTSGRFDANRMIRMRYPDEYQCNIVITKTEKGANAPNERASMMYTMIDCFPYAIDAVPLSYGASQVTKVTANFYYSKYSVTYNDIRGKLK